MAEKVLYKIDLVSSQKSDLPSLQVARCVIVRDSIGNIKLVFETKNGLKTASFCTYYTTNHYRLGISDSNVFDFNPTEMSIRLRKLLNRYSTFKDKIDDMCNAYINICMKEYKIYHE